MVLVSFLASLALFIGIGMASSGKQKNSASDYLLASQSIPPWLAGLSAVATYNSGFMFIGQIGYTYLYGLSSVWLLFGYITGDFLASLLVHPQIRKISAQTKSLSYIETLAKWSQADKPMRAFQIISGLLVVLLLGGYAAAQFSAGSKALMVMFDWPLHTGMIMGAIIVLLYCLAGGIRASIWTDAAQSIVMISAMVLMAWVSIAQLGGIEAVWQQLNQISPTYMDWFNPITQQWGWAGPIMFITGWLFGGLGVIGQPQVMVRFMTLNSEQAITRTRVYYYLWYTVFYIFTIAMAMAARLHLPDTAGFDAELALPLLSQQLLPPVGVGLILAGLFAATMSTADSIILVCSAALTQDVLRIRNDNPLYPKIATLAVTTIALFIALNASSNVFDLVILSAGTLATLFSPIVLILAMGYRPTQVLCFAMMIVGAAVHLGWRFSPWGSLCFEIFPGIMSGLLTFALLHRFFPGRAKNSSTKPQI